MLPCPVQIVLDSFFFLWYWGLNSVPHTC
jgi:hypothetical protein